MPDSIQTLRCIWNDEHGWLKPIESSSNGQLPVKIKYKESWKNPGRTPEDSEVVEVTAANSNRRCRCRTRSFWKAQRNSNTLPDSSSGYPGRLASVSALVIATQRFLLLFQIGNIVGGVIRSRCTWQTGHRFLISLLPGGFQLTCHPPDSLLLRRSQPSKNPSKHPSKGVSFLFVCLLVFITAREIEKKKMMVHSLTCGGWPCDPGKSCLFVLFCFYSGPRIPAATREANETNPIFIFIAVALLLLLFALQRSVLWDSFWDAGEMLWGGGGVLFLSRVDWLFPGRRPDGSSPRDSSGIPGNVFIRPHRRILFRLRQDSFSDLIASWLHLDWKWEGEDLMQLL